LAALALVLVGTGSAGAQVKDVADLLPAQTLACVEFRQADRLAREFAALLRGSAFEDLPSVMARFREKNKIRDFFWAGDVTNWGISFSPEFILDAGRMQGGAVALTGFSKDRSPEVVGVMLTGESVFPGLIMRSSLVHGDIRVVGTVEGVEMYRQISYIYKPTPKGADRPPDREEHESGPVMAMSSGAVILGSSTDAVGDVLRRLKRKSTDPSLASRNVYKDAAKLRDRPGVFGYVDLEGVAAHLDKLGRLPGYPDWKTIKAAVNPAAFRYMTVSLSLQNGNLEMQARAMLNAKETSPLLELLSEKKVVVDGLHFVPRDNLLTLSMGVTDGEKCAQKVVTLLDAVAGALGVEGDQLPSRNLAALEKTLSFSLGKDIAARLRGITMTFPIGEDKPGAIGGAPAFILTATSSDAARALDEKFGSKFLEALGLNGRITVARKGETLVVGMDSKRVEAMAALGDKKGGLLGQGKVVDALKEVDGTSVLGVVSLGSLVAEAFKSSERQTYLPAKPSDGLKPAEDPKIPEMTAKATRALRAAFAPLPPMVLTLSRKSDSFVLEMKQPSLRSVSAKAITVWVDSSLERALQRSRGPGRFSDGTSSTLPEKPRADLKPKD
jgi:hypothetical protein